MGKIKQLDTQTANMIAAGEVVERPMGVVKELVENAIDAGSTRIEIYTTDGGMGSITIVDDGIGMDEQDALMAFQRHATSKIRNTNDLWSINTLGFRGEALPSIASVAKVQLTTSDGQTGTRIEIEYGELKINEAYPCNRGTEIRVEGLFYRTPARLKHMRSAAYENSLIQDVIARFAMSHPEIAFNFMPDGREGLRTTGQGDLLEVLYQVWGREAAESALPISFEDYDYRVTGYLVKPNVTRASRNYMHVFLNGRMVRTYRIYKTIQDGYEDFIVKGRYPLVVMHIEMDPQLLDVNVHPSKWEVRLSKEAQLDQLIKDGIRDTLKTNNLSPETPVQEAVTYYEPLQLNTNIEAVKPFVQTEQTGSYSLYKQDVRVDLAVEEPAVEYVPPVQEPVIKETIPEDLPQDSNAQEKSVDIGFPEMRVIGQLHRKFILCEVAGGLAILDQHACQERVHYEEIRDAITKDSAMVPSLIPITLKASADLVRRVDELNEAVRDLRVVFEPFGPDTLLVREVPSWMKEVEETQFLQDILDLFMDSREPVYTRMEKKKIATMACHRSIRFNRTLTMQEMQEVVDQLAVCENPYHCPHGRPTFVTLDEKELTKEFLR